MVFWGCWDVSRTIIRARVWVCVIVGRDPGPRAFLDPSKVLKRFTAIYVVSL